MSALLSISGAKLMGRANYPPAKSINMYVSISVNKKTGTKGARLRSNYRLFNLRSQVNVSPQA